MMSLSAANTLLAVIATTLLFGACTTCRVAVSHEIVLSATRSPITVGHVGSVAPLRRIARASQTTRDISTASHITVLSMTCWPRIGGQTGSTLALVPIVGCTAL